MTIDTTIRRLLELDYCGLKGAGIHRKMILAGVSQRILFSSALNLQLSAILNKA